MDQGRIVLIVLSILVALSIGGLIAVIFLTGENNVAQGISQGDTAINLPTDEYGQVGGVGKVGEVPPYVRFGPPSYPPVDPTTPPDGTDPCIVNTLNICEGTWVLKSVARDDGLSARNGDITLVPYPPPNQVTNEVSRLAVVLQGTATENNPTVPFRFRRYRDSQYVTMINPEYISYTDTLGAERKIWDGSMKISTGPTYGQDNPILSPQFSAGSGSYGLFFVEGLGGNRARLNAVWDTAMLNTINEVSTIDFDRREETFNEQDFTTLAIKGDALGTKIATNPQALEIKLTKAGNQVWNDPVPQNIGTGTCSYTLLEDQRVDPADEYTLDHLLTQADEDNDPQVTLSTIAQYYDYYDDPVNPRVASANYAKSNGKTYNDALEWAKTKCSTSTTCKYIDGIDFTTVVRIHFYNSTVGDPTATTSTRFAIRKDSC